MKFLFLNSAGIWGGNEKWTHMAATSLAKEHSVYLAYKNEVVGERYTIEKIKLPFRFSFDPVSIIPLISFIRKNKIDVLIPTKKRDYVIAGITARQCGIINIVRLGIVRKLGRNPYKNFVYNKLTHGIIVNAQVIKDVLLQSPFMSGEKIRVIYNGLDIDALESNSKSYSISAKPFPFLVSTVGRVSRRKGIDIILKIFSIFLKRTQSSDAGLMIIGTGDRLDEYKKLAHDLGISEKVIFTGYLDNPYPYLKLSDVYLTASQNEGISNSLLEALYFKNAVITTRAGGAGDIIEDRQSGMLLKNNDINAGVENLIELYSDEMLRTSLGVEAQKVVLDNFSLQRMTSEIIQFSKIIIERSK